MDYHNVFQLTYRERNELFSALDKIADDPPVVMLIFTLYERP